MGGFSRACQSSTQKTTHVYKPFPKNINKNHVLNMSQHESTSITYPPRNFLTGIILIMLVQGNFPTGKIKNHRDFSTFPQHFPSIFQECWSALGAERDGVLRLRHLDPRSDELPGELRGSGIPRDPSVSLGADEPRHAMKMGDLMWMYHEKWGIYMIYGDLMWMYHEKLRIQWYMMIFDVNLPWRIDGEDDWNGDFTHTWISIVFRSSHFDVKDHGSHWYW